MRALSHRPFRMMLMDLAVFGETERERQLAGLTLDLYDTNPDDPRIARVADDFARKALDHVA